MFVGTFEHSLDDKGRVVLPATFRSYLAERGFVSQFDNCLGVWTEEGFTEVAKRLTEKIREGLAPQDAMRAFSANAALSGLLTVVTTRAPARLANSMAK
mgnify:CR=1 FL=1